MSNRAKCRTNRHHNWCYTSWFRRLGVSSVETCISYECSYGMAGVLCIYICIYVYIHNEHTHWWVYFCSGSLICNALHSLHGLQGHLFPCIMVWDLLILKNHSRKIESSLEAARLGVIMIVSFWNLTGISAAMLPRWLSNFRAIGKV